MPIAILIGFFFGFVSAIPVAGPVSAVVFSAGMSGRYLQGRWAAYGAAGVEAIYAFLAFWGASRFLPKSESFLVGSRLIASALLIGLGVYFYRSKKMRSPAVPRGGDANSVEARGSRWLARATRSFALGAGMSAVNVTLAVTWTATATTVQSMDLFPPTVLHFAAFAGGVGAGISVWFVALLALIRKNRDRVGAVFIDRMLKGIGALLIVLALWTLVRTFDR